MFRVGFLHGGECRVRVNVVDRACSGPKGGQRCLDTFLVNVMLVVGSVANALEDGIHELNRVEGHVLGPPRHQVLMLVIARALGGQS